jgi:hypothetical protein
MSVELRQQRFVGHDRCNAVASCGVNFTAPIQMNATGLAGLIKA